MALRSLSLKARLLVSFSGVALLAALLALNGYVGLLRAGKAQDEMAGHHLPIVFGQGMLMEAIQGAGKAERGLLLPNLSGDARDSLRRELDQNLKLAEEGFRTLGEVETTAEEKGDLEAARAGWDAWKGEHDRVLALLDGGDRDGAAALSTGKGQAAFAAAMEKLDALGERSVTRARETDKAFDAAAARARTLSVLVGVAVVAASLVLGFLLSSTLGASLGRAARRLEEGAHQADAAAAQLTASSQMLAEGSSEQAASLEEAASAMEEMAAMTRRNAASAGESKSLSDQSNRSVAKAGESMEELVRRMNEVSAMSEEIGKIIRTIDEIAFQTNLLALNAAVEAARAGEAGAGFAVVADEVRNLAQRAASAAKSTSELIEGALGKIADGTAMVERTSIEFREVVSAVRKVNELAAEVAAASSEQSRGIGEVSAAVAQMDKVTQGNAAGAEEIASASAQMGAQTAVLREVVRELQEVVAGSGGTVPAGPARKAGKGRAALPAPPRPPRERRPPRPAGIAPPSARPSGTAPLEGAPSRPAAGARKPRAEEVIPFDEDMSSF